MIVAGLDEAALGPKLGPFCACLIRFRVPDTPASVPPDLRQLLSPALNESSGRNRQNGLRVGDSKRLYRPGGGIRGIEEAVLAFLESLSSSPPGDFAAFTESFAVEEDRFSFTGSPWLRDAALAAIPWPGISAENGEPASSESGARQRPEEEPGESDAADSESCSVRAADRRVERLKAAMESTGLEMLPPIMRIVPAGLFNTYLDSEGGKGGAVQRILAPLMRGALESPVSGERLFLTVDRQGGRRYYGEWLAELASGSPLRAGEEGPRRSVYRIGGHQVEFRVKADASSMETALASMFAKYARETAMLLFNRWWSVRIPGLKPTAGYPQDAKRFMADLEAAGELPEGLGQSALIRRL